MVSILLLSTVVEEEEVGRNRCMHRNRIHRTYSEVVVDVEGSGGKTKTREEGERNRNRLKRTMVVEVVVDKSCYRIDTQCN